MADENSQDYEGYARTAKDELYDTPQNPKQADSSLNGSSDDAGAADDNQSDDSAASGQSVSGGMADDGSDAGNNSSSDTNPQAGQGNAAKDPQDWKTGGEPATPAQMSYISTMSVEAKEEVPTELTKAEASEKIHELQQKTGRDDSTERP